MKPEIEKRQCVWITVALAAVAVVPFLQALRFEFVDFDDGLYVTDNPMVLKGLTWEGVAWAFTTFKGGNWHPLTWMAHMVDVSLWGNWAGGHHLTSIIVHAANTAVLFLALRSLTGAIWRSALVAALFGIHPLHVESVAWVAERKDVLSAFFGLLAMYWYARLQRASAVKRIAVVGACMAISLMFKPMLVTLPFALLLLDVWPLRRLEWNGNWSVQKWALIEKLPLLALTGVMSAIAAISQREGHNTVSIEALSLPARMGNAIVSYSLYLQKLFVPVNLAVFYPHPGRWEASVVLGAAVLLATITVVAVTQWRSRPWLLMGWLFFLGTLVPVIGLMQIGIQAMADRYSYVPAIGVFLMVAWSIPQACDAPAIRRVMFAACGVVIAVLVVASGVQVSHWRDSFSLFGHAQAVTKDNFLAHQNYGAALERAGKYAEALEQYRKAVELTPRYAKGRLDLANMLIQTGQAAEAQQQLEIVIGLDPNFSAAHNSLGILLMGQGKLDGAEASFRRAVELDPDNFQARANYGAVLLNLSKWSDAAAQLAIATKNHPERIAMRTNLARALAGADRIDEAKRELESVLQTAPKFAPARDLLDQLNRASAGSASPNPLPAR